MSLRDGFGKKVNMGSRSFINLPEIKEDLNSKVSCLNEGCKGKIIKLETFNVDEGEGFNVYWRVLCNECFEEYKIFYKKFNIESKEGNK